MQRKTTGTSIQMARAPDPRDGGARLRSSLAGAKDKLGKCSKAISFNNIT
jgi:hypothetical protein